MDDKLTILLASSDVISRKLTDIFIDVNLSRTTNLILPDKYENNFNLLSEFRNERNSCRNFRLYGLVSSSNIDCDSIALDVYSSSTLSPSSKITSVNTTPSISKSWDDLNNYGYKKGKYYIELDNYNAEQVFISFNGDYNINNVFNETLIYTTTTYNVLGQQVVQVIDYGTQSTQYDALGNQIVISNDFPFMYNKHWVEDDLFITYPDQARLTYNVLPNGSYGYVTGQTSQYLDYGYGYIDYSQGQTITISATPITNVAFVGWSGDVNNYHQQIAFVMNKDKNITAIFKKNYIPATTLKIAGTPVDYSTTEFGSTVVDQYKVYTFNDGKFITLNLTLDKQAITGLESVVVNATVNASGAPITEPDMTPPLGSTLDVFPMLLTFSPGDLSKTIKIDTSNNYNYPSTAQTIYSVVFDISSTDQSETSISSYNKTNKNWVRATSNNEVKMAINLPYTQDGNIYNFAVSEYEQVPINLTLSSTPTGNEVVSVVIYGSGTTTSYSPSSSQFAAWNNGGTGQVVTWSAATDPQTKTIYYEIQPKGTYSSVDPMQQLFFQVSETQNVSVSDFNVFNQQDVQILAAPTQNQVNFYITGTTIPPYQSEIKTLNNAAVDSLVYLNFQLTNPPTGYEKLTVMYTPYDGIYYSPDIIKTNNIEISWAQGDPQFKNITFVVPDRYPYTIAGKNYETNPILAVDVELTNIQSLVVTDSDTQQVIIPIQSEISATDVELTVSMTTDTYYGPSTIQWTAFTGTTAEIYFTLNHPSTQIITVELDKVDPSDALYNQYSSTSFPIVVTIEAGATIASAPFIIPTTPVGPTDTTITVDLTISPTNAVLSDYNAEKNHSIIINTY